MGRSSNDGSVDVLSAAKTATLSQLFGLLSEDSSDESVQIGISRGFVDFGLG
jgi:hypothetical protein